MAELQVRETVEEGVERRQARLQRVNTCRCGGNRVRTESADSAS